MPARVIDPVEFPFTVAELRAALELVMEPAQARREAARHARGMRSEAAERMVFEEVVAGRRPHLQLTGEPGVDGAVAVIGCPVYVWYRNDALALMTFVSPELARRVHAHRAQVASRELPARMRQRAWQLTGRVDGEATPEVLASLADEDAGEAQAWEATLLRVRSWIADVGRAG